MSFITIVMAKRLWIGNYYSPPINLLARTIPNHQASKLVTIHLKRNQIQQINLLIVESEENMIQILTGALSLDSITLLIKALFFLRESSRLLHTYGRDVRTPPPRGRGAQA
jgi:hypothetical protein